MNTVFLLGDSTCAYKEADKRPETGWGMCFGHYIDAAWKVKNFARNGRSTKSFLEEGVFDQCLTELSEGDAVLIQFGHNDNKEDDARHTDPWSTYQGNLACMAEQVLLKQATPILLTPICRRKFLSDGTLVQTHGEYPQAMLSLCKTRGYWCLDMTAASFSILQQMGEASSKQLFLHLGPNEHANYPAGVSDDTHFNEKGAQVMCSLIVSLLRDQYPQCLFLDVS
ncbi:MAG: rhamnogalacturonan acetylesterase [Sphaerochaetaceae bacterium]